MCWHWEGGTNTPHIHIGHANKNAAVGPKLHVPSGRVAIEDVVTYIIDELGVQPCGAAAKNWRTLVQSTKRLFVEYKTW
jgi:hypothetical protein